MVRGTQENLENALQHGSVKLIEGDICDKALMDKLLSGCDLLVHLAALRITHCAAEPELAVKVMADATYDLLELCIRYKVPRVVAASSASIYGMAEQFPTPETHHPYNNCTLYGACKLFNEALLRSFADTHKLSYVATRYFNVYGPRMDMHGKYTEVMIRWMENIDKGLPPVIFGDGMQTMDFVHVKDVARANVLAAESAVEDEVFNIGSGTETSLKQLAELLCAIMGRSDLKPEHQPARAVNPVARRLADCRKARDMLGFSPEISLEDGLRELVSWWRGQKS